MSQKQVDIIVVGGGHAGAEAALAAARMGQDTVLFTINLDAIGNLPCNPSIGGTAKGHLVYEIDALGGEMGRAADQATLQSRTLNATRGAAVHSRRVQADRSRYHGVMKSTLEHTRNLRVVQSMITDLLLTEKDGKKIVSGVKTHLGDIWHGKKIIICAGTYLNAEIFVGSTSHESGPDGMMPGKGLTESLLSHGVTMMRFKTGTPARIHKRSIDFTDMEVQEGEHPAIPFSFDTDEAAFNEREQIPCHTVYTTKVTHEIILSHIQESALYSGKIHGTGPRYCPSIEDKLVRFSDKERHQLFVEPCGKDTEEMYLQGFSTSLPVSVQEEMLHSLPGFEKAEIMRYAYAIEYDCIDPTQLLATLEFKDIRGLYGAGQFNGTSGYEEAAAQGLVAGINAALALQGRPSLVLPRASSYIGTLIDDLVTKGTKEPYRMMTSRSEYRLLLRQDNADLRLTELGYQVGLISEARYARFLERRAMIEEEISRTESTVITPTEAHNAYLVSLGTAPIKTGVRLSDLLRRPELTYDNLAPLDEQRPSLPRHVWETAQIQIKYDGYIKRELAEVARLEKLEHYKLPQDIDYLAIKGLRIEAAQKLSQVKPLSIGQASRISGVSPADISVLLIYLGQS